MRRGLALTFSSLVATATLTACPDPESAGTAGSAGADGGVSCPTGPTPLLNLTIRATSGPVPAHLTLDVAWSAGAEPEFVLADASTWGTLAAGANVICDVTTPVPADLPALVCHLWTSGVTNVDIRAPGYAPYASTLKPHQSAACKGPVPTDVAITLAPLPDAGAGGAITP